MSRSKVLFFLSGSIAAFKACQVISRLVQEGCEVQTVATPSSLRFVGAATLEGLTGKPVLKDLWEEGRAMDHIHLSRWADFGVLCPASANTIGKMANGLADDLVSAMILAWPKGKPLHVFPAMNHGMLSHPATQENLAKLSGFGFKIHPTQAGNLACGEEGAGRLLEPEDILARLRPKQLGSVLITSGATREPIDGIRFLSNVSTGRTGATLADALVAEGFAVTYVHGQGAVMPKAKVTALPYTSFIDLDECLRAQLGKNHFTAVIHCAAVSDYSIASVNNENPDADRKLKSDHELSLQLKRNFKILPRLKEYSANKEIKVIGFKLTLNAAQEETLKRARELLGPAVDAVVANDWSALQNDRSQHPGHVVSAAGAVPFFGLNELSRNLSELIQTPEVNHGPMS